MLQGALVQQKSLDMQLRVLGREHVGFGACYHDIAMISPTSTTRKVRMKRRLLNSNKVSRSKCGCWAVNILGSSLCIVRSCK